MKYKIRAKVRTRMTDYWAHYYFYFTMSQKSIKCILLKDRLFLLQKEH